MTFLTPKSSLAEIGWPAVPAGRGAALLAMQFQLEQSQWWPPAALRRHQFRQLTGLLRHTAETVPFYRRRLAAAGIAEIVAGGAAIPEAAWSRLPPLSRKDIQEAGADLHSTAIPRGHGKVHSLSTSGSTGMPITGLGTQLTQFMWLCLTLRDQLWHGFDVTAKLAAIRHTPRGRAMYPDGLKGTDWGPSTAPVYASGAAALLTIHTPVAQQIEWLLGQDPDYLVTYPSNLAALLAHCREKGLRPARLRFVETLAEILHPEVRAACREVWGVKVVDMYSSQEAGYIALQCPDHEHYHVQAESVLVEVLDEDGTACRPGQTGRVVVTPLHNFAMPMIRYEVGDFATVGEPCPCGRGLPVLTRILGRARNMLALPSGARMWPYFGGDSFAQVAPVSQYQIVQKSLEALEVRLVAARPLTLDEEAAIRGLIHGEVGSAFAIAFTYVDEIARSKGGKFEDFRSEIAAAPPPPLP